MVAAIITAAEVTLAIILAAAGTTVAVAPGRATTCPAAESNRLRLRCRVTRMAVLARATRSNVTTNSRIPMLNGGAKDLTNFSPMAATGTNRRAEATSTAATAARETTIVTDMGIGRPTKATPAPATAHKPVMEKIGTRMSQCRHRGARAPVKTAEVKASTRQPRSRATVPASMIGMGQLQGAVAEVEVVARRPHALDLHVTQQADHLPEGNGPAHHLHLVRGTSQHAAPPSSNKPGTELRQI